MEPSITRDDVLVYEVTMANPSAHPMALTTGVLKFLGNPVIAREMANEYWNPNGTWACLEYLAMTMTVVAQIDEPIETMTARVAYSRDFSTLLKRWPRSLLQQAEN